MVLPVLCANGSILAAACDSEGKDDPTQTTPPEPTLTTETTDTGTVPTDLPTLPTTPTDTGPAPCSPALALTVDRELTAPQGLVRLTATGGTGAYRYTLGGDLAGALSPTTAFYLAGPDEGAVDTVTVTDSACAGEAMVTITTAPELVVAPSTVQVLPGTTFTVEVTGGSGLGACSLAEAGSGATLADCTYTAGSADGFDRVVFVDDVTGDSDESRITVSASATQELLGAERWAIPLGADFLPEGIGGSGVFDLSIDSGSAVSVVGDRLWADAPGPAVVRVVDRFTQHTTLVPVTVIEPQIPESLWYGTRSQQAVALAEDLDGDGFPEGIYGSIEIHGGAFASGGVAVYPGLATGGFGPSPIWTHLGQSRNEYTGRALALSDIDGDGHNDLVVGASLADFTFTDVGEIRIFRGIAGGIFENEPAWVLRGVLSSDWAGTTVGACDLDGDGYTDVIAGSALAEDRDVDEYPNDTGALLVFRGGPDGPEPDPSPIRYGALPEGGGWVSYAGLRMGELGLATGDVNGDGLCDVATGALYSHWENLDGNYGYVQVYLGSATGLLEATPARMYVNDVDSNAEMGREVPLDDFDGDGLADVAIAATYFDGVGGGSAGWVGVFLTASDDGRPATEPVFHDEADWFVFGRLGSDYAGRDIDSFDADNDGLADLFVGEPNGQDLVNTLTNSGRVAIWTGAGIAAAPFGYDATLDEPAHAYYGDTSYTYWGQQFAPVPDTTGDGWPELFLIEGQADGAGTDVQRPGYALSDGSLGILEEMGGASGHDHGRSAVLFDADDDGILDLVVGSPEDGDPVYGSTTGSLTYFAGKSAGGYKAVGVRIGDTLTRGSGDRMGYALAVLDFDGDGTLDLAAAARTDTMLAAMPDTFANPTECADAVNRNGSGLLAIWRGGSPLLGRAAEWNYFPPAANDNIFAMANGGDVNGDGRDDVLLGSRSWDPDGAFAIVFGENRDPSGLPTIVCEASIWTTNEASTYLGDSVVGLGDLDGDGCDEVAVGAVLEDQGFSNQGVVRVLWGAGGPGCPADTRVTTLAPGISSMQAGESLASGGDVDGDGIVDLIVGGDGTIEDGDNLGTVWVVPGSYLLSLPTVIANPGPMPIVAMSPLTPIAGGHYGLNGPSPTIDFGEAVSLVPDPGSPGTHSIAVGAPDSDIGGAFHAGGVLLYRWVDDPRGTGFPGISPVPYALFAGETNLPNGRLGETLELHGSTLLVGAPQSSQAALQAGGVYVFGL